LAAIAAALTLASTASAQDRQSTPEIVGPDVRALL
jgi:hypothetical protein